MPKMKLLGARAVRRGLDACRRVVGKCFGSCFRDSGWPAAEEGDEEEIVIDVETAPPTVDETAAYGR